MSGRQEKRKRQTARLFAALTAPSPNPEFHRWHGGTVLADRNGPYAHQDDAGHVVQWREPEGLA